MPNLDVNLATKRRQKSQKTKTGCKTCKTRRIKCDESRPVCGNCVVYFSNRIEFCEYDDTNRYRRGAILSHHASAAVVPYRPILPSSRANGSYPNMITPATPWRISKAFPTIPMLPKVIEPGIFDPFDSCPGSKLPVADKLLHHYLSTVILRCHPLGHGVESNPLVKGWWPMVKADTLLFHVMLQSSALDLEALGQLPNNFHSETYMGEVVRMLKDRLEDPVLGVSDASIGSVAFLAASEYGKRNMMAMEMHIHGLKRMVSLRGGLHKIRSSSPTTANIVFWMTLLIMNESQFSLDEVLESIGDPIRPIENLTLESSADINFEDCGVERGLSNILIDIRHLSKSFSAPGEKEIDLTSDAISIHSRVCIILQELLQIPLVSPPCSEQAQISECCRYAAAIYVFLPFENHYPDPILMVNSLLHKLKSSLGPLLQRSERSSPLLAWLLCVGGVAAIDLPERHWFVGHLGNVGTTLGLQSWADMRNCLARVLWMDVFCDGPFCQLWDEIALNMELLTEP